MTDKQLRLIEWRRGPTVDGPWSEPEIDSFAADDELTLEWSIPSFSAAGHPDEESYWFQERVVAYVPLAALEQATVATAELSRAGAEWRDKYEAERSEHEKTRDMGDEWAKQLLEAQDEITARIDARAALSAKLEACERERDAWKRAAESHDKILTAEDMAAQREELRNYDFEKESK